MKVYDFINRDSIQEVSPPGYYSILPDNSIILQNFSFSSLNNLDSISKTGVQIVFVDWSYDPIRQINYNSIPILTQVIEKKFKQARCIILSSKCSDYYTNQNNILWYPSILLNKYDDNPVRPRQKRIGCLNRRNAPHRIWLMHNLLSQGLVDHDRDIFSVLFNNAFSNGPAGVSNWISITKEDKEALNHYPDEISTVPDGFPMDYSVSHPAWNTAITVITETEVGDNTLITEKTVKGLVGRCCWMLYAGNDQFTVLTSLGFEIGLFDQHPTKYNIDPVLKMCATLDNESTAMDYYHSKIDKINHNYNWYRNGWLTVYLKKLNAFLT